MNKNQLERLKETTLSLLELAEELADQPESLDALEKDMLVWVRERVDTPWIPRYFSHVEEGQVRVFRNGADSATNPPETTTATPTFMRLHEPK